MMPSYAQNTPRGLPPKFDNGQTHDTGSPCPPGTEFTVLQMGIGICAGPNSPSEPQCPTGFSVNSLGQCIKDESEFSCPTGYIYDSTLGCLQIEPATCDSGQPDSNGNCVQTTEPTCPTGTELIQGQCVATVSACPTGYGYINGACYQGLTNACNPSDFVYNSNTLKCEKSQTETSCLSQGGTYNSQTGICSKAPVCDSSQILENGRNDLCYTSQQAAACNNPVNGNCVTTSDPTCPAGTTPSGEQCVSSVPACEQGTFSNTIPNQGPVCVLDTQTPACDYTQYNPTIDNNGYCQYSPFSACSTGTVYNGQQCVTELLRCPQGFNAEYFNSELVQCNQIIVGP